MTKKGLPVLGNPAPEEGSADRDFLEQPREISTPEFLQAVQEDRREDVAKMIVHDDRLVKSRDPSGATAVQLAVYHGLDEILGILLRAEVPLDAFEAAAVGDTPRVKECVEKDPSLLGSWSEDGFPLLGLAAFFGRLDTFDYLLEQGADPNIQATNPARVCPLHSAAAHRDQEASLVMARKLIAAGADIEAEQAGGFHPLHQAAAGNHLKLVDLLLEAGADPSCENDTGKTPLDLARERGHDAIIERLSGLGT